MTLAILCGLGGFWLGMLVASLLQSGEVDAANRRADAAERRRKDALDIERVLTREETAAIDRVIGRGR